jgi:hypothetical protein
MFSYCSVFCCLYILSKYVVKNVLAPVQEGVSFEVLA